jgi:hypothetical protein
MRLSDAGLRRRTTKLIYPGHRPSPYLTEVAAPRSLGPIVRSHHRQSPCAHACHKAPYISTDSTSAMQPAAKEHASNLERKVGPVHGLTIATTIAKGAKTAASAKPWERATPNQSPIKIAKKKVATALVVPIRYLMTSLTMRLSDAGLRRRQTKLIYPDHRPLFSSPNTRPRDRSNC